MDNPHIACKNKNSFTLQGSAPFCHHRASVLFAVTVLSILLKPTAIELLLMYLLPTSYNAFTAFFGVVVNLHFPRFDWISETQVVKQGASAFICLLGNMALMVALVLVYIYALSNILSLTAFAAICTAIFTLISIAMYFYLCGKGCKRFESL